MTLQDAQPVDSTIITSVRKTTGLIELNRPKALNSLNPEMINSMTEALEAWKDDDSITQVVVYTQNRKAFCSGGDVRYAREAVLAGDHSAADDFFEREYAMNALIANYPKPYIALLDGIVMGGGLGISGHGSHRVISENAVASMPEMNIAYITDVGLPFLSQRMVGTRGKASPELAKYWALTGYRMKAPDLVWSGLATHHVADIDGAFEAIIERGVDEALAELATQPSGEPELTESIATIEEIFTDRPWSEIDAALNAHPNARFVEDTRKLMSAASPTAVVAANELFNATLALGSVREELDLEVELGKYMRRNPDFVEGVRAVLVDKDGNPQWQPARFEEVDIDPIEAALKG